MEKEESQLVSQCLEVISSYRQSEEIRHETVGKELMQMRETLARMDAKSHTTPCEHLLNHIDQNRDDISDLYNKFNSHCNNGHAERIKETVQDQRADRAENRDYTNNLLGIAFKVLAALLGVAGILFTVLRVMGKV